DLIGCDPGTVGGTLGVDQVIDQLLDRRRADLLGTELPGALAQHGIPDLNDPPNAHSRSRIGSRTPRSFATSIARSYPASACRITPVPGSVVSTRSSLSAARSVPSATQTIPAWS